MNVTNFADSKTADGYILVLIVVLSLIGYVNRLGFNTDDWAFLAGMKFSHNQSLIGLYNSLMGQHDFYFRPIQWFFLAGLYQLFGLNPTGYHVVNSALLSFGALLLYQLAILWGQSRLLAISISAVFVLLPNYSTDRFWIAAFQANISMCFCFMGLYAQLKAFRAQRPLLWLLIATLCVFGVSFSYEVFLPLFLLMAVLLCYFEVQTGLRRGDAAKAGAGVTCRGQPP